VLGGYTMPRQQIAPGERFVITLYLMARTPVEENLNVLVRAVGADGVELLRDEGWPWGAATSTWQPGDLWPDGHEFRVPLDAAPGIYRVEVAFYDPETLDPFGERATIAYLTVAGPGEAPSQQQSQPAAQFGDRVQLLSASVDPEQVQAGADLPVRLLWQASAPLTESYTVFVHLVGPDGAMVAQRDSLPRDGFYPTQFWQPGLEVEDETILSLPADLAAGAYTVHVGLYDSASLERLSVLRDGDVSADSYSFPLVVE